MTRKKIDRISVIYREKIVWLQWYFLKDKEDKRYTILEKKLFDSAKNRDLLAYQKYSTIKQIIDIRIQTSNEDILKAVKEVYVYKRTNVIGACQNILYLSPTAAYNHLNAWFNVYSDLYFSIVPLPSMAAYNRL